MSKSRYDVETRGWSVGSSHDLLFQGAITARNVLDVGCSTGGLASALVDGGSIVVGLDRDAAAVQEACRRGVDARVVDIEAVGLNQAAPGESFDCVVFGDILEHLVDPGKIMIEARSVLNPGGYLMVSVPNVSHGSVTLGLILDRWDARDVGLLDRTHLRFFTLDSFMDLAESCGYAVIQVQRVVSHVNDPTQTATLAVRGVRLVPDALLQAIQVSPEASTLQFVFRLEPIDPKIDDVSLGRQLVIDARIAMRDAVRENVSLRSEVSYFERRESLAISALSDAMRSRDEVIGLEAECGNLRIQLDKALLSAQANEQHRILQVAAIQSSVAWRVGRALTFPFRVGRGAVRRAVE